MSSPPVQNGLPLVDVAMLTPRREYGIPRLFFRSGCLGHLYTDVYLGNKPIVRRFVRLISKLPVARSMKVLLARDSELPPQKVTSFESINIRTRIASLNVRSATGQLRVRAGACERFGKKVLSEATPFAPVVYACNHEALEIFGAARDQRKVCILEQTIAPRRIETSLLTEENALWPGWEKTQFTPSSEDAMRIREEAEWELASKILSPSQFVTESLKQCGVSRERIEEIPYGVDRGLFRVLSRRRRDTYDPLRVLFVGRVSLVKGIQYLLAAAAKFPEKQVHFRVVGPSQISEEHLKAHRGRVEILRKVPVSETPSLYEWADVFVLPSICEGSAMVCLEAMACGLPVITTRNAGSVVRDGVDGFVVPIRDTDALAGRLDELLRKPGLAEEMGRNALEYVQNFSAECYQQRLLALVRQLHRG